MLFKKEEPKEEIIDKFRNLPSRKLSEIEKQLIFIMIEKSKVQRERSLAIFNKGFLIFIAFIIIAYLGKSNDIIPASYLSFLFLFAVIVLIVSITLYERTIKAEESNLNALLDSFLK